MNLFKHISVFVNFVYHNADYLYVVAMPPCYGDDREFTVICTLECCLKCAARLAPSTLGWMDLKALVTI